MKCQILFSGKNKKNNIILSSAENAQRVVKVKQQNATSQRTNIDQVSYACFKTPPWGPSFQRPWSRPFANLSQMFPGLPSIYNKINYF